MSDFSQHSAFFNMFAGTCLFVFGMSIASENLQKLASNRIRDLITKLSKKRIYGIFLGIALTVMIQSSGAVTSLLVGLGSVGVISLEEVMSIILGATIGTTLTVQLISFNVAQYGLSIFAFAFPVYFLTARRTLKQAAAVLIGFGLIFWGLEMIGQATELLKNQELFLKTLDTFRSNPIATILLTGLLTALVNSSAVTIGFAMTLANSHVISLTDAIYWVFGANIGTTATALIAATGSNFIGRQIAWAHCFYKIAAVLLFFPLTEWLARASGSAPAHDVANVHTLLNVAAAIIFYPFITWGARMIQKLYQPTDKEKEFSVEYLHKGELESPSVALAQAEREALRMADIVLSMLKDSLEVFKNENADLEQSIRSRDDKVDVLNREITLFVTQHMEGASGELLRSMMTLTTFVSDLESAADVIDNNLLDLAKKKHLLKVEFSEQGWKDLEQIYHAVVHVSDLSISCFQRRDRDIAAQVIFHKRNIRKLEKRLRELHIERLVQRRPDSLNTSSIHLDLLGEYRRFVGLIANHCYAHLKDTDRYNILPRRE
jgi:phosphate:Na+ symporter